MTPLPNPFLESAASTPADRPAASSRLSCGDAAEFAAPGVAKRGLDEFTSARIIGLIAAALANEVRNINGRIALDRLSEASSSKA